MGCIRSKAKDFFASLKASFAFDKTLLHTFLLDVCFYLALWLVIILPFNAMLQPVMAQLQTLPAAVSAITDFADPIVNAQLDSLRYLGVKLILLVVFLYVGSLVMFTLFKGVIWSRIASAQARHPFRAALKKTISWPYLLKSFTFNLVISLVLIGYIVFVLAPAMPSGLDGSSSSYIVTLLTAFFLFFLLPLAVYLTALFYTHFDGSMLPAFTQAAQKGVMLWRYILHILVILIVFAILFVAFMLLFALAQLLASSLFAAAQLADGVIYSLLAVCLLIVLLAFAWARKYFYMVVSKNRTLG